MNGHQVGELRIKALEKTKFLGYGPDFNVCLDWIETGDIASISREGNVEILTNKCDLIYDRNDNLVKHWEIEKLLAQYEGIKGVQLVQICHGAPVCKSLQNFFILNLQLFRLYCCAQKNGMCAGIYPNRPYGYL